MAKTIDEKVLAARKKATQSQNELKRLLQLQKEEERKARTHRLVERGAMLESLMGISEGYADEEIREVLAVALSNDAGRKALLDLRTRKAAEPEETEEPPGAGA